MSEEIIKPLKENIEEDTLELELALSESIVSDYNEKPFPIKMFSWNVKDEDFSDVAQPNFDVIISQEVLLKVNRHVSETLEKELGGFLLGNRYYCPMRKRDYIQIDNFSDAKFSSSDEISLTLSPQTWFQLQTELDGKNKGKQLMGWYHSHPKMSVFISPMDVVVHKDHFSNNKFAVALVVEPERMTGGFFCWRWDVTNDPFAQDKTLHQNARMNFFELKDVRDDRTYMPWSEYSCFDCETTSAGKPQLAEEYTKIGHKSEVQPESQTDIHTSQTGTQADIPVSQTGASSNSLEVVKSKRPQRDITKDKEDNTLSKWFYPALATLLGIAVISSLGYLVVTSLFSKTAEIGNVKQNNNSSVNSKFEDNSNSLKSQVDSDSNKLLIDRKKINLEGKPYYLILTFPDERDKDKYSISLDDQELSIVEKNKVPKNKIENNSKDNNKIVYYEIPIDFPKLKDASKGEDISFALKLKNTDESEVSGLYDNVITGKIGEVKELNDTSLADLQRKRDQERQSAKNDAEREQSRREELDRQERPDNKEMIIVRLE